jgi:predicted nucleotidyltransferase
MDMLHELLGSRLRANLIGWLFTHADERYFVRQLTALLGEDPANTGRELARLERLGILASRVEGRQTYYQANRRSPLFPDLRGLAVKTAGLCGALRDALAPLRKRIRVAWLFGSFAEGRDTSRSDVDMLIIGDLGLRDVVPQIAPVGRRLGREINAVIYTPTEFQSKARHGHHFVEGLLKRSKLYLMGGPDDLKRIVG